MNDIGVAGFWMLCPASSLFGSQLWSCRLEKSCHCQAVLEVLLWGYQQHRTYLAPTVSPPTPWVPGLLSTEHLLELLSGVEVMAATLP